MAVTRLAPSPTGALHLGNARTFLATWAMARQAGWRIAMRIEDLDGPRIKSGAAEAALDDLRWLGLDWDGPPLLQSTRHALHRAAIDKLIRDGRAYPCVCTRKEVESAASAPHAEDGAAVYPGTCRGRFESVAAAVAATGRSPALRFAMPDMTFEYRDEFAGVHAFDLQKHLGDFVIAKPDGIAAYQLAVVVDDAAAAVTHVVRGADLIDSVPRQVLLYQALGLESQIPAYIHLPLVVGADDQRLAKRYGDTRVRTLRAAGITAGQIDGWLCRSLGIDIAGDVSAAVIAERFDLARVPRHNVVFADVDLRPVE